MIAEGLFKWSDRKKEEKINKSTFTFLENNVPNQIYVLYYIIAKGKRKEEEVETWWVEEQCHSRSWVAAKSAVDTATWHGFYKISKAKVYHCIHYKR